jgi:superfamily I DNA/RNA helicase
MNSSNYFELSAYQRTIFDWVVSDCGDVVVEAVAGSGKTKTLVEAARFIRSDKATFIAFNKHIVNEIQDRLGNSMRVKTIHSIGCRTLWNHLGQTLVDEDKYAGIAKPYAQEIADDLRRTYQQELRRWSRNPDDEKEPAEPLNPPSIVSQLKSLAHFCRVTLTPPEHIDLLEKMVAHFNCLEDGLSLAQLQHYLKEILRQGEEIAIRDKLIDFDDMLWLPWKWNLHPRPQQQWLMVDECQDLSAAQLDLVLKLRGRGGRILFVGDRRQSIMGFAGADNNSVDNIIARTNATVLPLSICYRCPSSHIKLASEIVPQIESRPDAPVGIIKRIARAKLHEEIKEGDLVISRCAAPAIKLCIELIAKRVPAKVRGRDIGNQLTTIVKEVGASTAFEFNKFSYFLNAYQSDKIAKLQQKKNSEAQIESLKDRVSGIVVCYQAFHAQSIGELCAEIEDLFSDSQASVMLSTVHRAKGLENDRVFILRPDQLPLTWRGQRVWELEQEKNLRYIALTRAKQSLYFIDEERPIEVQSELFHDDEEIPL